MTNNFVIVAGRRKGMTDLRKRGVEMDKLAQSKKVSYNWENEKSHYIIYIDNENGERIFEERVLTRGVNIVQKIHAFYDIFEKVIREL